ncbi:MAG: hypothetical protein EBT79_06425 [Actinobacteria bacterium]|nr:hypothetical protein [Actinomycetota bacterium]
MKIEETSDVISVGGTYKEMEAIIQGLKKIGFRWDSIDRVWTIPVAKMTPASRRKLQDLVDPVLRVGIDQEAAIRAFWERERMGLKNLYGLQFSEVHGGILVAGIPKDLNDDVRRAGGVWLSAGPGHLFSWQTSNPATLESMFRTLEAYSGKKRKNRDDIADLLGSDRSYPTIRVQVSFDAGYVVVSGDTQGLKDELKRRMDALRWTSPKGWVAGVDQTTLAEVQAVLQFLDKAEAAAQASAPPSAGPTPPRRTNQKAQDCARCGDTVPAGEGWLHPELDDDDDRVYWRVIHKDQAHCDRVLNEKRERARAESVRRVSIRDAINKIRDIARRDGQYPSGSNRPPGERVYLGDSRHVIYGGGEWVVFEPNGEYLWYVQNNGADGDDWSYNNVETGGAGGIGHRVRVTDELKALVEIARGS